MSGLGARLYVFTRALNKTRVFSKMKRKVSWNKTEIATVYCKVFWKYRPYCGYCVGACHSAQLAFQL